MGNHVNNDRRLKNLDKKLRELETDIDKKQKEKKGTHVCMHTDKLHL